MGIIGIIGIIGRMGMDPALPGWEKEKSEEAVADWDTTAPKHYPQVGVKRTLLENGHIGRGHTRSVE